MVVKDTVTKEDFIQLLKDSKYHRGWTAEDVKRIIFPLLKKKQALFAYDNDNIQGMVTWAWVDPQVAQGYLEGTQKLTSEALTGSSGDLWAIDFIAPYGNVKNVIQSLTDSFKELHPEHKSAKMFRRAKNYASKVTLR